MLYVHISCGGTKHYHLLLFLQELVDRERSLREDLTAAKGATSDLTAERDALRAKLDQQQQVRGGVGSKAQAAALVLCGADMSHPAGGGGGRHQDVGHLAALSALVKIAAAP